MTEAYVRFWMQTNKLKATQVAGKNKCSDAMICQFLKGKKTSQKLVDFFIDEGCPKKYFKNGRVAA